MLESEYVFNIIYKFYPRFLDYDDRNYKKTKQHIQLKKILNDKKKFNKDIKKYYNLIKNIFKEYAIVYKTNLSYPSYHYSILLARNQDILDDDVELMKVLGGHRFNLEIFISRLCEYYYIYTTEDVYNGNGTWHFFSYDEKKRLDSDLIEKLNITLRKEGLKQLSYREAHTTVPCLISTELLPYGGNEIKVFNCLFSDMITDFF